MAQAERRGASDLYFDLLVLTGFVLVCLLLFPLFRQLAGAPDPPSRPAAARASGWDAPPAAASQVATLLEPGGDVRVRRAGGMGWSDAHASLALHDEDAVQTFTRSRALLRLDAEDYLQIGERSLIVLGADADHVPAAPTARRATLLAGTLGGTVGANAGDGSAFELELPGARVSLLPGPAHDTAIRFLLSRNPDASSSISLFAGRARLVARRGTESIAGGYGVTLDAHGNLREARALPPAPDVLTPAGGTAVGYRDVPPRIAFGWSAVGRLSRYRLRVARDPDFHELLVDERVNGTSFTLNDLHAGDIYWSVSALDRWHEGRPGVPRRLRILRDAEAPALSVDAVHEPTGPLVVRGRTEEGARVYVQGRALEPAPGGEFETRIERRPGAFLLVVEAVDAVGNTRSDSRIVTAPEAERATVADAAE